METRFIGRTSYEEGLRLQETAWRDLREGHGGPCIFGFEFDPVITMGLRAKESQDLNQSTEFYRSHGLRVIRTDRGGQSTYHGPGQLVIYPVVRLRDHGLGVRQWVLLLAAVTRECLAEIGVQSVWDECRPGIYTSRGKLVSIGLRVRQGISQHGLALNIEGSLEGFQWIRACGQQSQWDTLGAQGIRTDLLSVFELWSRKLEAALTVDKVAVLSEECGLYSSRS